MFKKKKCPNCGEDISKHSNYCHNCGSKIRNTDSKKDSWGMLGKDDFFENERPSHTEIKLPFGFNTLFNTLVKSMDKQLREIDKQMGQNFDEEDLENKPKQKNPFKKAGGFSISISSSGNKPLKVKVNSFGNMPEMKRKEEEIKKQISKENKDQQLSSKNLKKLSKLPKEEPRTNIRRLSDKIIYEIAVPGVESIEDISIIKLENSIEIKAVGKDKAYFKLIPINMPIIKKKLEKDNLVLEFKSED